MSTAVSHTARAGIVTRTRLTVCSVCLDVRLEDDWVPAEVAIHPGRRVVRQRLAHPRENIDYKRTAALRDTRSSRLAAPFVAKFALSPRRRLPCFHGVASMCRPWRILNFPRNFFVLSSRAFRKCSLFSAGL